MNPRPNLTTVPRSSEGELRELFREEDELIELLETNRRAQKVARRNYARSHGLLILPSFETLRKVLLG